MRRRVSSAAAARRRCSYGRVAIDGIYWLHTSSF
jgi:hypothetical protein